MKDQILFFYDIINPFFGWPRLLISYVLEYICVDDEITIEEDTYSDNESEQSISDVEYEEEKEIRGEDYFELDDDEKDKDKDD